MYKYLIIGLFAACSSCAGKTICDQFSDAMRDYTKTQTELTDIMIQADQKYRKCLEGGKSHSECEDEVSCKK